MERGKKNNEEGGKTPWVGLLESAAKQILGVLLTAGGLIGFVAFAGAVIVWTRFSAANVPPDQAVNAVPREELVAIGASLLLIFGFFGILAMITMYLIDRSGRVTTGMTRALLLLLTIEGVTAIGLAGEVGSKRTVVVSELFLLSMGVLLWSTFSARFTEQDVENLTQRTEGERHSALKDHTFRTATETDPISKWTYLAVLAMAFDLAAGAGLITLVATGSTMSAWMVGLPVLAIALALAVLVLYLSFARHPEGIREALENADVEAVEEEEIAEELKAAKFVPYSYLPPPPSEEQDEVFKPRRLDLKLAGVCLVVAIFVIATIGPSLILGKAWIAVSLGSAAVLSAGLWRIGYLAAPSFIWYGLAVFVSVPLFGTLTAMARNIEDPQVQPMALIRNTDGPDEAIQGIYVTEADNRVYFATAETEGCTNELSPHSGRLLWVPKSEVVAMTVGPSQDVEEAANTALEMSYALTPGLGLPNRDGPSLASAESAGGSGSAELDKRLGSVGAAVHPNFGSGLALVPPDASPGGVVTLRVSLPNKENGVKGFGVAREGRTLRVGGVPAPIIRESVKSASEAEFVKTEDGKVLALDKEGVYGRGQEGGFYPIRHLGTYYGRRFLKLGDSSGAEVKGEFHRPDGSSYLALKSRGEQSADRQAALLEEQKVILKSGEEPKLETYLLRQGWHEDHIKFRVPDNAASGVVSVECRQLAGEPVLDVARPPKARIAVRMQAGSESVSFDSSGSSDDGAVVSRRWMIEGHARGGGPRLSLDLPPRLRPYSVRLIVTDEDRQSDSAQLRLARLPASLFGFDKEEPEDGTTIERIGESLAKTAQEEAPIAVELDGHTDKVGSASYNLALSLRRVEAVRKELLPGAPAGSGPGVAGSVPVALRAFGESCPLDRRHIRSQIDRRVEVFLLGQGATVAPRPGCRAGREEKVRWWPPSPPP